MPSHPTQPVVKDHYGILRFHRNAIVCDLLNSSRAHGFGLNEIAAKDYTVEDRRQLAQLIGYNLGGYSELGSYVDDAAMAIAQAHAAGSSKSDMEIELDYLRQELKVLKESLKNPIARLYGIHPHDLTPT